MRDKVVTKVVRKWFYKYHFSSHFFLSIVFDQWKERKIKLLKKLSQTVDQISPLTYQHCGHA